MNQYEHYEAPSGGRGCFLKILKFCLSEVAKYVHFASCGSYLYLCEALRLGVMSVCLVFMNYMNIYEEGSFMAIFSKRSVLLVLFMNIEKRLSSYWFINPTPNPSPNAARSWRGAERMAV
jgi:hypothetical protein